MLDNLKFALFQHRKFLVIFFVVVFLPSLLLAVFGIRAIQNERYKLQQRNLEQQREFAANLITEIRSFIEERSASLKELSSSPAVLERDVRAIRSAVSLGLTNESLLGEIVLWHADDPPWFPALQDHPPSEVVAAVPEEWTQRQPGLNEAEELELRRRDFAGAISRYRQLFSNSQDRRTKAWLQSRIARCEVKRKNFGEAVALYRLIASRYPDLLTESGRPLELASRLGMLDALRATKDHARFLAESLATYSRLQENRWSLDGDQLGFYAVAVKAMTDKLLGDNTAMPTTAGYLSAIEDRQAALEKRLSAYRLGRTVQTEVLPALRRSYENQDPAETPVERTATQFEGHDALALLVPIGGRKEGQVGDFLGSLFQMEHLKAHIDSLLLKIRPPGVGVLLRSSLSHRIIYGEEARNHSGAGPVFTDAFHGYFLPWQIELYQTGQADPGTPLYMNIFFWTILALLFILFFGSGLIIRTVVQEVRLLNLKSDFIASVSHEFKTPLTSMGAILEHLASGAVKDPERTREYYTILQHDSDKLTRLVKNVLDFSKIEDGKRDYRFKPADIVRLVRKEVASWEKEGGLEGITVRLQTDNDVPGVLIDEEAIGQALHNILDNAARFSADNRQIDVHVRRNQDTVEIAVQDRGIGIPETELKRVFEKFYRGKQAVSVSPTGTGLGLALVKHIMRAHKGDVIIRSRPREGCRVSLTLPICKGGR